MEGFLKTVMFETKKHDNINMKIFDDIKTFLDDKSARAIAKKTLSFMLLVFCVCCVKLCLERRQPAVQRKRLRHLAYLNLDLRLCGERCRALRVREGQLRQHRARLLHAAQLQGNQGDTSHP